jgi:hypothetical protein
LSLKDVGGKVSDRFGIERSLKQAEGRVGQPLYAKYQVLKDRLFTQEYSHWAAAFPGGNDHGPGHIERVLEKLDQLLDGNAHGKNLVRPYELFLCMMSILYHDIGLLRGRADHADISSLFVEEEHNDYLVDPADRDIISAAVVSHSSSKDIREELARFAIEELIGGHSIRPHLIAALVRLADELDEDFRRADPIVQRRLTLPADSKFFWEFCQRVRGIRPDRNSHIINMDIAFTEGDVGRSVVIGGRRRAFVSAFGDKLAKINSERMLVNHFLPNSIRYHYVKLSVKPPPKHGAWKYPRDFIFGDYTSSLDFVTAVPELLVEPAGGWLLEAVRHMRAGRLGQAGASLARLRDVLQDLPWRLQLRYFYDSACLQSLKAELAESEGQRNELLKDCMDQLLQWLRILLDQTWRPDGEDPYNGIFRMSRDSDLHCLLALRRAEIVRHLPEALQDAVSEQPPKSLPGVSFGCSPRGTLVATPDGVAQIEHIREGDRVLSVDFGCTPPGHVQVKVLQVHTLREASCMCINGRHVLTPSQPVCVPGGRFVPAQALDLGSSLVTSSLEFEKIRTISTLQEYFEVYTLTTDHPSHNYLAGGIIYHNSSKWG